MGRHPRGCVRIRVAAEVFPSRARFQRVSGEVVGQPHQLSFQPAPGATDVGSCQIDPGLDLGHLGAPALCVPGAGRSPWLDHPGPLKQQPGSLDSALGTPPELVTFGQVRGVSMPVMAVIGVMVTVATVVAGPCVASRSASASASDCAWWRNREDSRRMAPPTREQETWSPTMRFAVILGSRVRVRVAPRSPSRQWVWRGATGKRWPPSRSPPSRSRAARPTSRRGSR